MVLLWQATDSYVPPFYKGKALPTVDSTIKVVAMPEIRSKAGLVNPRTMTYAWKRNYTNDVESSGYGKNFYLYDNDYLENADTIEVTTSTVDGLYSSQGNITVGASEPGISFYRSDSTMGTLWEQALSDGYKIRGDETVIAEPYFISPKEILTPRLLWSWFINDNIVDTVLSYKKNLIPLRVEDGTSGIARLRLQIDSQDQILESVSKEINIEF